ncbi:uncharacterized protein LOC116264058 isoform X3 [Nymphaea colorata]|uniref:uncharacterized protein LOC116264058 isoform X3 n=1 Tax=Nymphaea colorata TaxID=210225 RepID=UPI00214EE9B2|nr:uncharacterized protein LOC116264058 isoform X3 [Nymphaea colorata]
MTYKELIPYYILIQESRYKLMSSKFKTFNSTSFIKIFWLRPHIPFPPSPIPPPSFSSSPFLLPLSSSSPFPLPPPSFRSSPFLLPLPLSLLPFFPFPPPSFRFWWKHIPRNMFQIFMLTYLTIKHYQSLPLKVLLIARLKCHPPIVRRIKHDRRQLLLPRVRAYLPSHRRCSHRHLFAVAASLIRRFTNATVAAQKRPNGGSFFVLSFF